MVIDILKAAPAEIVQDDAPQAFQRLAHVEILGVPFSLLSLEDAVAIALKFTESGTPHQICLSNAYSVAIARKDDEFMRVLWKAHMVLADGMSIVWGGRWIQKYLPSRVAGPDFMEALCKEAAVRNYRIFLLGSSDGNLQALSRALLDRYPALQIAGSYSPPMCEQLDDVQNKLIKEYLKCARPHILFVSLSAPKQEKWIAQHFREFNIPLCIGVGAAFDFISGRIPRAPQSMQDMGLEWLFRLYCEPRRLWKRYVLGNSIFLS